MIAAYYNEIDPFAVQWLRNLIGAGLIAQGEVDDRSIRDVQADDLVGFRQCHFFAGIGVWSHALRSSGWPDDREVWTGSCPCQPFSVAGSGKGTADERHLWPEFFRLIGERRPAVVIGEQVASKDALSWLDLVSADLEGSGYAVGAADLCAAGVGAPHIRQRLYWVANINEVGRGPLGPHLEGGWEAREPSGSRATCGMGDSGNARGGRDSRAVSGAQGEGSGERSGVGCIADEPVDAGAARGMAYSDGCANERGEPQPGERTVAQANGGVLAGFWANAEWLTCSDGKARPVEPGTQPLAHGAPSRVGRLRAYGNAICAPLATEFVRAVMECAP